ncbi:MAG: DUF4976 domain-containing protein [Candidatus Poribacteria bacterium]|nr:DUF4976 domain-containing protein [Candidatus Poribacteria bacterium]
MRGEPGDEPSSILLTLPIAVDQATAQNIREWRGIRTKWYTYARWFDGDGWILYDNDADPFQLNNRIDDPAMAGLRKTLDAELNEWLAETDDRSLSWDDHIRELGLADVWNDRERHMHPKNPRLIRT